MPITRIGVLGAAGRTGQLVIERALARGLAVKALVRDPAKLGVLAAKVTVVQGAADDPGAVRSLVDGCDAIISALGTAGLRDGGLQVKTIPVLMQAMKAAGVRRYAALSSSAASLPTDTGGFFQRAFVNALGLGASRYLADKQAEVDGVQAAGLDWTLLRAGVLEDGADGPLQTRLTEWFGPAAKTSRPAIASALVQAVVEGPWVRQAPFIAGP